MLNIFFLYLILELYDFDDISVVDGDISYFVYNIPLYEIEEGDYFMLLLIYGSKLGD